MRPRRTCRTASRSRASASTIAAASTSAPCSADLASRGVATLLVEGGPTIAGAFLEAGLVDEVVGYVRAGLLGAGRPLVDLAGVATIADLRPLRLVAADIVGDDVRIRATVPSG